jgi:hypothetical protein
VNEIPPNPSSGETVFDAPITGDYYLEVAASTLTWTITPYPRVAQIDAAPAPCYSRIAIVHGQKVIGLTRP